MILISNVSSELQRFKSYLKKLTSHIYCYIAIYTNIFQKLLVNFLIFTKC